MKNTAPTNSFRSYIHSTCTSFTVGILLYTALYYLGIASAVTAPVVLAFFALMAGIGIAMFLTDRFTTHSMLLQVVVHLAIIFFYVFVFGGGFLKLFPLTPFYILLVSVMILAIYGLTVLVLYAKTGSDAQKIDDKLKALKKKQATKEEKTHAEHH